MITLTNNQSVNYFINKLDTNNYIKIDDYKISFNPFDYHWSLNGLFFIIGNFNLPPKSLGVNFTLSNQTSHGFLNKLDDNCLKYNEKYENIKNCNVYQINHLINLSGDNFFKRKIRNEEIKIKLDYTINTTSIQSLNLKIPDTHYNNFLQNLYSTSDIVDFYFTNTYEITDRNNFSMLIPYEWSIYKRKNIEYKYANLWFDIPDYKNIKNETINDLYKIYINEKIDYFKIENLNSEIHYWILNNYKNLKIENDYLNFFQQKNLFKNEFTKKSYYDIEKQEILLNFINGTNGIFIPKKSNGIINHNLLVNLNHHSFYLNINNKFNFLNNFIYLEDDDLLIDIKSLDNFKETLNDYQKLEFN